MGVYERVKPYMAVILLQFGYAGMSLLSKVALNEGMSSHVLVVYRHAVATIFMAPFAIVFERKTRPKMTLPIFAKIVLLGLLEPTIDQNLFYLGMKNTTATFTSALVNVLPTLAFVLAWIFRLEKVDIRRRHSQAKILGTVVTVGGAMLMTLFNGPMLDLPWARENHHLTKTDSNTVQHPVEGALMISSGCFCWASFFILQAYTLRSYPTELSLTVLICLMGTVQSSVVAVVMERNHLKSVWALESAHQILTVVYSGVICSGMAFYIQGAVMKVKGPVFVTAFSPLSMVIVAVLSSFILSEIMYLGRVAGAFVIVVGLYLVLWGKTKDLAPSIATSHIAATTSDDLHQEMEAMREIKVIPVQDLVSSMNLTKETP